MTERQVKVTLSAQVNEYLDGMDKAARKTREVGSEAEKLGQQTQAFNLLGRTGLAMGAALGAGLAVAIGKAAEFDQAMSYVSAATHETADNMDLLRDAALDAGARTVYSATEAANAIEELGKAGVGTTDILSGGLDGALNLAAAGGIGVAQSAGIAATALKTFKLEGSDMAHVADLMAAGAGKAMGGVGDLGAALDNVGLQAANSGLSIEETTGFLAAFASYGKIGGDAGTAFKSMLQALSAPSAEATRKMDELNISAYDTSGNFVGLAALAGNLRESMVKLTPAQRDAANAIIFGSYGVQAATALYNEGADGIREWTEAVDDQGYAAETAALRLDNLAGDAEKLAGSFDTALITSGSAANDMLRFLTQSATGAVDTFNQMPDPVQGAALALGAVAAATSIGAGAFLLGVPKVAAYRIALETLGPVGRRTGRILEATGKAAGTIALVAAALEALSMLAHSMDGASASGEELQNALKVDADAANTFATALKGLDTFSLKQASKDYGAFIDQVSSAPDMRWLPGFTHDIFALDPAADAARDKMAALGTEIAGLDASTAAATFQSLVKEMGGGQENARILLDLLPDYKAALTEQATSSNMAATEQNILNLAMSDVTPVATDAADAYMAAADEASSLDDELRDLIASINEANGVGQDAVSANIDFQNALAAVDEEIRNAREGVEGYSLGLDQTTQVGRDHMDMLTGLAGDYQAAAEKQFALDGNTETYVANLQAGRDAVLQRARDLGATDEQIQFLSDHIVAMPSDKEIKIIVDTAKATSDLDAWIQATRGVQIGVGIYANKYVPNEDGGFYNHAIRAFESGGFPSGMYAGRRGGIHKFAEESLPWETYISPKPGKEQENIGYALDALSRLGYQAPAPAKESSTVAGSDGGVWAPVFQLAPQAGRSVADQAFEAARRMKIRR